MPNIVVPPLIGEEKLHLDMWMKMFKFANRIIKISKMGLFGRGKSGGAMNVIRCDLPEYLIWKWRPGNQDANTTSRENAIRYGSSLRVKDGEVAVFVYQQKDGTMQDYIVGPYDDTIKTANFPVLANIVGMGFGGESPFQAEVYFINMAEVVQIKFAVPYFDVADPRFLDFTVPVAVGGTITFNLKDYRKFIKLHRLINFDIEAFKSQVKAAVIRRVKSLVTNVPADNGFPVVQIERKIDEISDMLNEKLKHDFEEDFGVNLKRIDITRVEIDKESEGWYALRNVTLEQQQRTINAQTEINLQNLQDTQRINAMNMEETLRIQREEAQRAQQLQTETQFISAHALDRQAEVLKTAAENLGQMGQMGEGGGMNPASMMAGMAVGGAVGNQMAGMMAGMGNAMGGQMQGVTAPGQPMMQGAVPPPPPDPQTPPAPDMPIWMIAINGQQSGPFSLAQLQQLVANGQFTAANHVWRQGMPNWEVAGNVPEIAVVFAPAAPAAPVAPPPPPGSQMPPMP